MKFFIVFFILLLFPSLSSAKVIFSNCKNIEPMLHPQNVFIIDIETQELTIEAVSTTLDNVSYTQVYTLEDLLGERFIFRKIVMDSYMPGSELEWQQDNLSEQYVFDIQGGTLEYSIALTQKGLKNEQIRNWWEESLDSGKVQSYTKGQCDVNNLYLLLDDNDLNDNRNDPIVEIDLEELVPAASGSGFFVSDNGHLVSNFHVIDGCQEIKIHHNGLTYDADILAKDSFNDLALMKIDLNNNKYFEISNEDPRLLEEIITAGFPLGRNVSSSIKTSKGSVTSIAGYGDNYSEFQMDAAINQGNSGGPIMNYEGEIVGVAVAIYGREVGVEGFNFGIKASVLKTFLVSNKLINSNLSYQKTRDSLEELILDATKYVECWMTNRDLLKALENDNSYKAFIMD